ncbi:MAG TPA: acyl-CoA dehydrogenase, partial [Acidimicrobiales bacterium]|nr:acyl-CoA dehydrogenase [Acidimicrobiales bacterium]
MTTAGPPDLDLSAAKTAVDAASGLVGEAARKLADKTDGGRRLDDEQVFAYDLAHAAAGVHTAAAALRYGEYGPTETALATAFAGDVVADLVARTAGREATWACKAGWHGELSEWLRAARSPELLASLAETPGPVHLDEDFEL